MRGVTPPASSQQERALEAPEETRGLTRPAPSQPERALEAPEETRGLTRPAPSLPELFQVHLDSIWRCLRGLGVPASDLDDAAQDVFLVAHRRLLDFQGRSSIETWLYGIAVRVAHDHRRRIQRKGATEPLVEAFADPGPDPLQRAADAESREVLWRLLERLDEPKREVLVLAELEERSAPEIAEILNLNLNTVYSRLRAARQQFDQAVAGWQRGKP